MRTFLLFTLLLAGCASTDQVEQQQIALYGPKCRAQGFTSDNDVRKCVFARVDRNEYFWATTQNVAPDSGTVRSTVPVPVVPPPADKQ
jgi:hypothetical protein